MNKILNLWSRADRQWWFTVCQSDRRITWHLFKVRWQPFYSPSDWLTCAWIPATHEALVQINARLEFLVASHWLNKWMIEGKKTFVKPVYWDFFNHSVGVTMSILFNKLELNGEWGSEWCGILLCSRLIHICHFNFVCAGVSSILPLNVDRKP